MTELSGREMGRRILDGVRGYVARALSPLIAKLRELEAELAVVKQGVGAQGAPGERGVDGKDGRDGVDGKNGKDGVDGKDGAPGSRGEKGERGEAGGRGEKGDGGRDGKDGRDGRDGQDGKDGAPGRDALALDILPTIDEEKTYPRGTYAKHLNGLWRAAGDTQGMRGWECLVAGVASWAMELRNERLMVAEITLSTGEKSALEIPLGHPLDRGVYQPDFEYLKGDGVTWAGSWWIAQVDKPTDKPGISEQWRLAVKRGRDGKDAK